ncbi:MAG: SgcJ/EcaC family oxidoreductase [Mariniblastus sp.]|nr:SgcJ/EcaC family oxidoreductase [Mariniblastus sp.]
MKIFARTIGLVFFVSAVPFVHGQAVDHTQDEQMIRKSTVAYQNAFNQGDAVALAALWAPDGEYIDQTATLINGREEIQQAFTSFFVNNKGQKININIDKIGFPLDELAFELGSTVVTGPDGQSRTTNYSANYAKRNGVWMLLSVHELPPKAPSNYGKLKDLDWLQGNWTTRDPTSGKPDATVIAVSCYWSANQNFLIREFSCVTDGKISNLGTQRIGWHAPSKSIRSWSFDFKGGVVTGSWKPNGKDWIINTREALNNGQELTAVERLSIGKQGEQIWELTDQMIGDQAFPNKTYTFRQQN